MVTLPLETTGPPPIDPALAPSGNEGAAAAPERPPERMVGAFVAVDPPETMESPTHEADAQSSPARRDSASTTAVVGEEALQAAKSQSTTAGSTGEPNHELGVRGRIVGTELEEEWSGVGGKPCLLRSIWRVWLSGVSPPSGLLPRLHNLFFPRKQDPLAVPSRHPWLPSYLRSRGPNLPRTASLNCRCPPLPPLPPRYLRQRR